MNKAEKETLLRRTAPSRQKQAQEYLQGRSPGTMQRYAPDAHADPEQGLGGGRGTPCAALQNGGRKQSTDAGRARPAPLHAACRGLRLGSALAVCLAGKTRSLSTI